MVAHVRSRYRRASSRPPLAHPPIRAAPAGGCCRRPSSPAPPPPTHTATQPTYHSCQRLGAVGSHPRIVTSREAHRAERAKEQNVGEGRSVTTRTRIPPRGRAGGQAVAHGGEVGGWSTEPERPHSRRRRGGTTAEALVRAGVGSPGDPGAALVRAEMGSPGGLGAALVRAEMGSPGGSGATVREPGVAGRDPGAPLVMPGVGNPGDSQ